MPILEKNLVIESTSEAVSAVCREILAELTNSGFGKDDAFAIHLAAEEALINAIKHGNKGDASKKVKISYKIADKFEVFIEDHGNGFAPEEVPDPRCKENLYKPHGRGLLLMKAYMDLVEFNKAGNCLHMVKNKTGL